MNHWQPKNWTFGCQKIQFKGLRFWQKIQFKGKILNKTRIDVFFARKNHWTFSRITDASFPPDESLRRGVQPCGERCDQRPSRSPNVPSKTPRTTFPPVPRGWVNGSEDIMIKMSPDPFTGTPQTAGKYVRGLPKSGFFLLEGRRK